MLRIAITGGIGSGKTAVTNYLECLGFTVVDADVISREMTGPGGCAIERIAEVFGPDIASIEKTINRILKGYELSGKSAVFVAAPLLFEYDMQDDFDAVWLVVSDEAKRIARVAERDGLDAEMITRIIDSQLSDEEKSLLASDIIENNSTVDHLKDAVNVLLDKYKLGT